MPRFIFLAKSRVAKRSDSRAFRLTEPRETFFGRAVAIAFDAIRPMGTAVNRSAVDQRLTTIAQWATLTEGMAAAKKRWSRELRGLGDRARLARRRVGLGVREAADAIGISNSSLSRLENGERLVDLDVLIQLADLYHVTLDWLLAERGTLPRWPGKAPAAAGDRRKAPDSDTGPG